MKSPRNPVAKHSRNKTGAGEHQNKTLDKAKGRDRKALKNALHIKLYGGCKGGNIDEG